MKDEVCSLKLALKNERYPYISIWSVNLDHAKTAVLNWTKASITKRHVRSALFWCIMCTHHRVAITFQDNLLAPFSKIKKIKREYRRTEANW